MLTGYTLHMTRLNELSLRSISVAAFTAALMGWAKRLEQHYSNQKSVASKMKQSDDPNVKLDGEARENEAVAELLMENRLLKKSVLGDGEDDT